MEEAMKARLAELLPEDALTKWHELTGFVEKYYDTDILQNKGFGDWEIEYKYRRGGKSRASHNIRQG